MQDHPAVPLTDYVERPLPAMAAAAATLLATMRRRHSVRQFSDRPVPRSIIADAIATAATAPSGANHQPWFFVAIGSADKKARLRELAEAEERAFYAGKAGDEWLAALGPLGTDAVKPYLAYAPWIIAVFGQRRGGVDPGDTRKNYYIPESVGIAMGFLIAAVHHAGLVALTHTPKPMSFLNDLCDRPADEKPYLLLVVGYPADGATVPAHALKKKAFAEFAAFL